MNGLCETVYETAGHQTVEDCNTQAEIMTANITKEFPDSYGQMFCVNQKDFEDFQQQQKPGKDA
jgi:hypothetical protein